MPLLTAEDSKYFVLREMVCKWLTANCGPFNIKVDFSFEKWTFYFKNVDLYFFRAARPNLANPPATGLQCS